MMNNFSGRGMMDFDRFGSRFDQMHSFNPGMWLFGLLIAALVITAIVFLIIALVRYSRKNTGSAQMNPPVTPAAPFVGQALQILDERLARGEIDTDEYRKRKDELLRP